MAETPFEISVTLNATAQLLESVKPPYTDAAAVAPSAQLENIRGYDVEVSFLKSTFLQFKRPYVLDYQREPLSFHTDHKDQLATLKDWERGFPRSVFYALPLVPEESQLTETLDRTLFVDVRCLDADTSRIRVDTQTPASKCGEIPVIEKVQAKVQNGDWYDISKGDFCCMRWETFRQGLVASTSGLDALGTTEPQRADGPLVGVALYEDGDAADYPSDDIDRTVLAQMTETVRRHDISFSEQGLEAAMLGR